MCIISSLLFHLGPSIKDACTLGGEGGQAKVEKCWQGEGVFNKGGRLLGQKIIATIFVKFTQIIWQYVCI